MILTDEEIGKLSESCSGPSWCYDLVRKAEALIVAKLAAQDVEPVGYIVSIKDEPELGHWFSEGPADAEGMSCQKLYTEAQLIAIQQRTAEACAKLAQQFGTTTGGIVFTSIRSGAWREFK